MDDAGRLSLKGFFYQIKIFIYNIIENIECKNITYEGKDDIECSAEENKLFFHKINDFNCNQFIQVKNGKLDNNDICKIVLNWLKNSQVKTEYILVHSKEINFGNNEEIINIIVAVLNNKNKKKLRKDSIYKIIFDRYKVDDQLNEKKLKEDIKIIVDDLINKHRLIKQEEIDEKILKKYSEKYCGDIKSNAAKEKRLSILISLIQEKLKNNINLNQEYQISFSDFNALNNIAISQVTDDRYQPDYKMFKSKKLTIEECNEIYNLRNREVKQLQKLCFSQEEILKYLSYELFYRDIREVYLDGKKDQVNNLELSAYERYNDEKIKTEDEGKKLFCDVVLSNDILEYKDIKLDMFSNKGCFIHLTSDETEDEIKITWVKDDE